MKRVSRTIFLVLTLFVSISAQGQKIEGQAKQEIINTLSNTTWHEAVGFKSYLEKWEFFTWDLFLEHANSISISTISISAITNPEELGAYGKDLLVNYQDLLLEKLSKMYDADSSNMLYAACYSAVLTDSYLVDFLAVLFEQEWAKSLVVKNGYEFEGLERLRNIDYATRAGLNLRSIVRLCEVVASYFEGFELINLLDGVLPLAFEYALDPDLDSLMELILGADIEELEQTLEAFGLSVLDFLDISPSIRIYTNILKIADTKEHLETYLSKWIELVEKLEAKFGYTSSLSKLFLHAFRCKSFYEMQKHLAEGLMDCVLRMRNDPMRTFLLEQLLGNVLGQAQLLEILIEKVKNLDKALELDPLNASDILSRDELTFEVLQKLFAARLYDPEKLFFQVACVQAGRVDILRYLHKEGILRKHPALVVTTTEMVKEEFNTLKAMMAFLVEEVGLSPNNLLMLSNLVKLDYLTARDLEVLDSTYKLDWAHPAIMQSLVMGGPISFEKVKFLLNRGSSLGTFEALMGIAFSSDFYGLYNLIPYLPSEKIVAYDILKDALDTGRFDQAVSVGKRMKYLKNYVLPHHKPLLIGMASMDFTFSSQLLEVFRSMQKGFAENVGVQIIPITQDIAQDSELIQYFSAFLLPGNGDSFPQDNNPFGIEDLDPEKMRDNEILYQTILEQASRYHTPVLGICSGHQHIALHNQGKLHRKGLGGPQLISMRKGTVPHFMLLYPEEQNAFLATCLGEAIELTGDTAHGYSMHSAPLSKIQIGGAAGEVIEAIVHRERPMFGFQFHPENGFHVGVDEAFCTEKTYNYNLFSNFLNRVLGYYKTRKASKGNMEALEAFHKALVEKLENCEDNNSLIIWGEALGDQYYRADQLAFDFKLYMTPGTFAETIHSAKIGEDLVLINKETGAMLTIEGYFSLKKEAFKASEIHFADGISYGLWNATHSF